MFVENFKNRNVQVVLFKDARSVQKVAESRLRTEISDFFKIAGYRSLRDGGLEIVERVPVEFKPSANTLKYLTTKKMLMGHLL